MLDCFYPSLSALVAACREIRAYLRTPGHQINDNPAIYNITRILPQYEARVIFQGATPVVAYFCTTI